MEIRVIKFLYTQVATSLINMSPTKQEFICFLFSHFFFAQGNLTGGGVVDENLAFLTCWVRSICTELLV